MLLCVAGCRASAIGRSSKTMRIGWRLRGWVRNRRDGSVEAVFSGPRSEVEAAIEACRRGPYGARVDALDQREGTDADLLAGAEGSSFSVRPTA